MSDNLHRGLSPPAQTLTTAAGWAAAVHSLVVTPYWRWLRPGCMCRFESRL